MNGNDMRMPVSGTKNKHHRQHPRRHAGTKNKVDFTIVNIQDGMVAYYLEFCSMYLLSFVDMSYQLVLHVGYDAYFRLLGDVYGEEYLAQKRKE